MSIQSLFSLFRGRRGERGLPSAAKYLPAALLVFIARRRRSKGFYDGRTLALLRAAWQRSYSVSALVELALFRRDLGRPLSRRWLTHLTTGLSSLGPANRRRVLALLTESAPQTLSDVPLHYIAEGAGYMAPVAYYMEQRGDGIALTWLTRLHERQQAWRDNFAVLLRQSAVDGICLVGNSGSLIGSGLGSIIDSYELVVRFNLFSGQNSEVSDLGNRLDVWVGSPGFAGVPPQKVAWAVSTGPDMRFRRQNWAMFEERLIHGLPVLTVPLTIWRDLVVECCAPPSAGILLLAWIRDVLGSWQGVFTAGIGIPPSAAVPYHHAAPRQLPYDRHDWEKERALLSRWRSEGLQSNEFSCDSCEK